MDILERLSAALRDRYAIERELGAGGMATVHLAEDLKHRRKVAVKVLRPELAAILGAERFLKEIEVTANLQHPHILPLHDSGEADSFLYYVMPYVEGESLREKLNREKQLGVDETIAIATAVAHALDYAHRHCVIHRDIKPENILSQDGEALVADFGIARAVTTVGGTRLTETGLSLGTPQYMSPEQAAGDREVDARSDVYSLGAVVYELLTGDPPHDGKTMQAIVAKVLSEAPTPIARTRASVPQNVDAAVMTALAKTPADRFASAGRFASALTDPSYAHPARAAEAPRPFLRVAWPTAVAVAVAAAASGWLRDPPPSPVVRSSIVFAEDQQLVPGNWRDVVVSPNGSRLLYRGESGEGGVQLYIRPLSALRGTPIPGTDGADNGFFSPDGQFIGFTMRGGILRMVDLVGGPPSTVTDSAATGAWGADGMIYFMPSEGFLYRTRPGSGRVETLNNAAGRVLYFDALPGGKGALLMEGGDVAVLDYRTRGITRLFPGLSPRYVPTGHILYLRDNGTLYASPFDEARLEVTGEAVALVEGVAIGVGGRGKFAVSDDGTLVYQPDIDDAGSIALVAREGSERLVAFGLVGHDLKVSPDGQRAAVSTDAGGRQEGGGIWMVDLASGARTRFSVGGYPEWTPDGQRVAFFATREGEQDLYWRPLDGSTGDETVFDRDGMQNQIAFTADNRYIVYREGDRTYGEGTDLHYLDTQTGEHHALTQTPAMERSPRLSPDGRWLAYVTNASGRDEVWVRAFPGPGAEWPVTTEGGAEPLWAGDGEELFYRTATHIVSVAVDAGETLTLGRRTTLFRTDAYMGQPNHTTYDVLPGDSIFAFVKPDAAREVIMVQGFFEELKTKVGN